MSAPATTRMPRGLLRAVPAAALVLVIASLFALFAAGPARADEIVYVCNSDICTIDANHPETHVDLTGTSMNDDNEPAWSPDGTRIAFSGDYGSSSDIYVTSPASPGLGTDISDSTNVSDGDVVWSADGKELAWTGGTNAGDLYIYFAAADGTTTPQTIAATPEGGHIQDYEADWSPTGAQLAFARRTSVYLASPFQSTTPHFLPNGGGIFPSWSPDGTKIAAVSADTNTHVIHLIDAVGSELPLAMPVTAELGSRAEWSSDGSKLVYIDSNDQVRVAPTNPPGAGYAITLPAGVIVPHRPSFSPDGSQIVFTARNTNQSPEYEHLYLAPAAGGEATQLTKDPETDLEPVWKPEAVGPVPPGGSSGGGAGSGGSAGGSPSGSSGSSGSGGSTSGSSPSGSGGSGGGAKTPVTIKFAAYAHPVVYNGFMGAGYVDCSLGSTNAACLVDGEATYVAPITHSRDYARPTKAKRVVFAKGAVKVPHGKKLPLRLKVTAAGRRLARPGKKLKVVLALTESVPGAKTVRTSETLELTVKGPKK